MLGKGAGLCPWGRGILQPVVVVEPLGGPVLGVKCLVLPCEYNMLHVHGMKSPL